MPDMETPPIARVRQLSTTPIKGLQLHHPEEIDLTRFGAVGDRRFLLIDDDAKPVSITLAGALVRYGAIYEPHRALLTVISVDGHEWAAPVSPSTPLVVDFYGKREVACRLVDGPWAAVLSEAAGRRVRLVWVDRDEGGFDIYPVTLLGTASVAALARAAHVDQLDIGRFRMLIDIDTQHPHIEDSWQGDRLSIGQAEIVVRGPVPRCAAITRHPETGIRDQPLVRLIRSYRGMPDCGTGSRGVPFGVYAEVVREGVIRVGDPVERRSGEP